MADIAIATEDVLSERIAEKLVSTYTNLSIDLKFGLSGNGKLKANLKRYAEIARNVMPLLLITDLDNLRCAPELISGWLSDTGVNQSPNLLLRVAVHETESWLLADHENLGPYFRANNLPRSPDEIIDAKEALIRYARQAPRNIKDDIVAARGSQAKQGLGYNARLSDFIKNHWHPKNARQRSDSLNRICTRLTELSERVTRQL